MQSRADPSAKALEGAYRPEPVFTLTQSLALYDFTHQPIAACDQEIERVLSPCASLVDPDEHPRSISSSQRSASIGIHGPQTSILPPGWASVPIIRSVAATCSPRAVGGSKTGLVAPCAWPRKVSARAPAIVGRFFAACAAHWGQRKPPRPRPINWRKLSTLC